jgi:hypothetical protein
MLYCVYPLITLRVIEQSTRIALILVARVTFSQAVNCISGRRSEVEKVIE